MEWRQLLRRAQRSGARLGFCSLPSSPLSAAQSCGGVGGRHPCRVGNHGLGLVLCMHLGGCAADVRRLHKCRAVQSLQKSFPGCAEPTQPLACSAVARLKQNTCGSRQLGLGLVFFSGQCYLEMDALLVIFSSQVPDFKMIAKFIAFPPPFYCPRSSDPWGFALLCKGAAGLGLPSLWESSSFGGGSCLGFARPPPLWCCH